MSAAALTPTDTSAEVAPVKFHVNVLGEGLWFYDETIAASKSRLWVSLLFEMHDAKCKQGEGEFWVAHLTTMFIQNGELFLYGEENDSHQKLGVDVKGKGVFSCYFLFNFCPFPTIPLYWYRYKKRKYKKMYLLTNT